MKSLLFRLAGLAGAWGLLSCLSIAMAALPPRGSEPVAEIPYRIAYQGWFTVQASVNGTGPHDFIVDSGATITSVFANLAVQQEMPPVAGKKIQILGLTGAQELPAYMLGDIDFNGVSMTDHLGVVLPDWAPPNTPPQGVMGLDLLTRYAVHVDTKDKVIRFYDPAVRLDKRRGWVRTRMKLFEAQGSPSKLYTVEVKVNAARIPCILDLGASGTIFNTEALRNMISGVRRSPSSGPGFTTGSRVKDVFDVSDRAQPVRIQRLKIGSATWHNRIFAVYDAPIFADLGYERKPFCLIGADMFSGRSILFDFKREKLYIGPER